jgi:predicted DNA-binding transcriptional regulator AlpA
MSELLTEAEVADYDRIPASTLNEMRARRSHSRSGEQGPPFYRLGRAIRYERADVEAWLNEKKVA